MLSPYTVNCYESKLSVSCRRILTACLFRGTNNRNPTIGPLGLFYEFGDKIADPVESESKGSDSVELCSRFMNKLSEL